MGHSLIGKLPRTKEWDEVSRIISDGADPAQVADATLKAAELAMAWVQNDAGFREAIWLLTQLGVAGTKDHPLTHLGQYGLVRPEANSVVWSRYARNAGVMTQKILSSSSIGTLLLPRMTSAFITRSMPAVTPPEV